jgi:uncharacterized membrane protein YeiH
MERRFDRLLLGLDLAGTFVFAIVGASAAHGAGLDLLGAMVLAFSTALGGGIVRDLLIGATPPGAIRDWRYATVAFAGGAAVLFFHEWVVRLPPGLLVALDAAGLSLFAVAGAQKALESKLPAFLAVLMGAVTGAGGGTIRDLFLARVPLVLRADIYVLAAIAGAAAMVIARRLGASPTVAAILGAVLCFAARMTAVALHLHLPIAP